MLRFLLFSISDNHAIIELIAVDKSKVNKGIGSQLLNELEYFSKEKALTSIKVGTQIDNSEAIRFYTKINIYINHVLVFTIIGIIRRINEKILIVSTVSRQFYLFEQSNIKALRALNFEVHGAANFEDRSERLKEVNVIEHHIDIQRSPFSLKNIKAIKQLEQLVKKEKFDVIHCHAPVGGVLGRLVGKKFPNCKVIYTAHGFHFFRGAPLKNWLLFYPIEKFLSKYTDHLITINNEDYKLAKEKFNMKNLHHINGIGVDLAKFQAIMKEDKYNLRQSIGFSRTDKILIYVGELSYRKNQTVLINAMETVVKQFPEVKLLIVGKGILMEEYRQLIKEKI